jgi:hypothetical protein
LDGEKKTEKKGEKMKGKKVAWVGGGWICTAGRVRVMKNNMKWAFPSRPYWSVSLGIDENGRERGRR